MDASRPPNVVLLMADQISGQYPHTHGPTDELYDLETDPHELYDLAGQPGNEAEVERLRGLLLQWLADSEADRRHPTANRHSPVPRWSANT